MHRGKIIQRHTHRFPLHTPEKKYDIQDKAAHVGNFRKLLTHSLLRRKALWATFKKTRSLGVAQRLIPL